MFCCHSHQQRTQGPGHANLARPEQRPTRWRSLLHWNRFAELSHFLVRCRGRCSPVKREIKKKSQLPSPFPFSSQSNHQRSFDWMIIIWLLNDLTGKKTQSPDLHISILLTEAVLPFFFHPISRLISVLLIE